MKFAKGYSGIFWVIYMLFFAIGLPLIIHYAGGDTDGYFSPGTSSFNAFMWLSVGTLLWLIVFIYYLKIFLINLFIKENNIKKLLQTGERRKGIVLDKQIVNNRKESQSLSLDVEFSNFSKTIVTKKLDIIDTKPYEQRFEKGKSISIILDRDIKPPYMIIDEVSVKVNVKVFLLIIIGFLLIAGLAAGLLIYSYIHESRGYGWRYLYFWHPYISIPAFLLFYYALFKIIIGKFFNTSGKPYMLLYGKWAEAEIISRSETGTYVNGQPQVLFTLLFRDGTGRKRKASFKKIVSLLDVGNIQAGTYINILYDPKNPEKIEPL